MNGKKIITIIINLGALLLIWIKPEYTLLVALSYLLVILWRKLKDKPILKFKITKKK